MRPYEVETINGREQRNTWPADKSEIVLQGFKREAISELRVVECKKARAAGIGHLVKKMADGTEALIPAESIEVDGKTAYKIDPIASTLVHTGAETMDLTREKYAIFCSSPQSHGMITAAPAYAKKAVSKRQTRSAITETPMTEEPPKRKPGRPRKSDKL